jgi:hypothetical protein
MTKGLFIRNGCIRLLSLDNEDDLKPTPEININPPPLEGHCQCCRKHISELNPFGGLGGPFEEDFSGAMLVKILRFFGPFFEKEESAYKEAQMRFEKEGFPDAEAYLADKYGPEEAQYISGAVEAAGYNSPSWECRDCVLLDWNEYIKKMVRGHNKAMLTKGSFSS